MKNTFTNLIRRNWNYFQFCLLVLGVLAVGEAKATTCASATDVTSSLPFTSLALTCGTTDDLNATTVPTACGGATNNYKGGFEALYSFTAPASGSYTISYTGQTWSSIFVYQGCPSAGGTCINSVGSSASSKSLTVTLTAGLIYYVWFDTWPTPNSPCAGTFGISIPALPACSAAPSGGSANITAFPVCGGNFSLGTLGSSAVSGLTYQWQDSLPFGVWTDISTATGINYTALSSTIQANHYFRRNVTCTASSLTGSSAPILVKPIYPGISISTVAVCGGNITLSLQNTSAGVSSYQWLSSTDSINWSPILSGTTATFATSSPTVKTFYRCLVTCSSNSSSDTSLAVTVKPVLGGTTTLVSSICNDSTTLSLSGASTGAITYNWLQSSNNISWVPTSLTNATPKFPSPSAVIFYRAVLTCGIAVDSSSSIQVNEPCQGFRYSISSAASVPYTSIQATGSTFVWNNLSGDDDRSNPIYFPSGFNFTYNGQVRPAFYVCTNGWLSLDTTVYSNTWTNDLTATTPKAVLAPFWEDLVTLNNSFANNSYIKYQLTGTAPNRVMTVEWAEMERYQYGSPSLNFQVKFFEGTNNIQYVYGRMQGFDGSNTGGFDYSLGMTGNNPAIGQKMSLLVNNTSNFSTSLVNNALPRIPLCNTSYTFTAGGTFNPTNTSNIPTNDSSSFPVVLGVNALPCTEGCGTYYTSLNATPSVVGPNPVSGNPDDDVWFQFTAPLSGQVNISLVASSGYDPAFQVMSATFDTTGLGAAGSRNISTSALENVTAVGLVPSANYLIRVFNAGSGAGSTSGAFSICVNEIIPPPANDDTTGAISLTVQSSCTPLSGTTLGATASSQAVCGGLADDDVWYKFTPSASTDTVTVTGLGTFRPYVQILSRNMTSLSCQNSNVNAGIVKTTITGLLKDSTYFIRVYHTNAGTGTANFTICVTGSTATTPVIQTNTSSLVIDVTATISANILSNGGFPITESGLIFSTIPGANRTTSGVIDSINSPVITNGIFTKNLVGLTPSTTYYVRAYAVNAIGITYGGDSSFTTTSGPIVPIIQKIAATNVQAFSATIGGNITSNGGSPILESGIVYGTLPNPNRITGVDSTTTPIVINGVFTVTPSGLLSSTKYYYRAYATNSVGTAYSIQDSFTTAPVISSFPYTENFDGTTTAWTTSAINAGTNAWVRGTPAKTVLSGAYSSPNAMVTFLTGSYLGTEDCVVLSPQFNFATFTSDPVLRFRHNLKTDLDLNWDGGVIEISINGGTWTRLDAATGTGANFNTTGSYAWYNNASGSGTLGSNKFNGITSSYSSNTGGWVESATRLTGAAGQSNVKIRFRFWADGIVDEGWAIDDITVVNVVTPTLAASSATAVSTTGTTANVSWTNGNGNGRIVVARLAATTAIAPTNNKLYLANTTFGLGDSTGLGNYIVYNGTSTSTTVTGLLNYTNYEFDVYEFNGKYMHNLFTTGATSSATTLPVKLISFNGIAKNNDALLTWVTASETNNKGFEVERSIDGRTFEFVNFVKGAGNSNKTINYSLTDAGVLAKQAIVYYRLKQVDFDGKVSYSEIIRINKNGQIVEPISIYPNPFANEFNISYVSEKEELATVDILDVQGKNVYTNTIHVSKGLNIMNIADLARLNNGIYIVRLKLSNDLKTVRLLKN